MLLCKQATKVKSKSSAGAPNAVEKGYYRLTQTGKHRSWQARDVYARSSGLDTGLMVLDVEERLNIVVKECLVSIRGDLTRGQQISNSRRKLRSKASAGM